MRDNDNLNDRVPNLEKEVTRLQVKLDNLEINKRKSNNRSSKKGKQKIEIGVYDDSNNKDFNKEKVIKISPGGHWICIKTKNGTKEKAKHNIIVKNDDRSDT